MIILVFKSFEMENIVNEKTRGFSQISLEGINHSIHAGPHRPGETGLGDEDSWMYVVYKDSQITTRYIITYESL